jgi:hypothetical protein
LLSSPESPPRGVDAALAAEGSCVAAVLNAASAVEADRSVCEAVVGLLGNLCNVEQGRTAVADAKCVGKLMSVFRAHCASSDHISVFAPVLLINIIQEDAGQAIGMFSAGLEGILPTLKRRCHVNEAIRH